MDKKIIDSKMIKFFDERALEFDYKHMNSTELIKKLLSDFVNVGDKVFDIGCGVGTIDDVMIELGASEIYAIDLSQNMINKAKELTKSNKVHFFVKDLCDCNFSDFDLAIVYNSYVHVIDRDMLLSKLVESLRVGGRFAIINTNNYKNINLEHSEGIEVDFSRPMLNPFEEQNFYSKYFDIDTIVDDDHTYIISGIKKC